MKDMSKRALKSIRYTDNNEYLDALTHAQIVFLKPWDEAVGLLVDVLEEDSMLQFENFTVVLRPDEFDEIKRISAYIGERVSVLKTDIPEYPLLIRSESESIRSHKKDDYYE